MAAGNVASRINLVDVAPPEWDEDDPVPGTPVPTDNPELDLVVCDCQDYWCLKHELHYFECECPSLWGDDEEWEDES